MREQPISITVDAVIFNESASQLVLVQRKNEPFKHQWALPGGFLEENETLENGTARELKEETGLEVSYLKQIGAFGAPERDPRGRIISVAFTGKVDSMKGIVAGDDAKGVGWFSIDNLPSLAFDHLEIIKAAKKLL